VRSPYQLTVEVFENPDVNEPNDTTPTPIALQPVSGVQQGTGTGYLATDDDVDKFSVAVPTGTNILYLNLTAPRLTPPTPFRLAYSPDSDWYKVVLPANSSPTALHWKVTPGSAGGRFPPLPGDLDRQLRVLRDVTGTNAASLCRDDQNTCPKNYENTPALQSL